ncbi:hypothetical protein CgunFtcFv8_021981 [Champsocephalus gunnari]|uniref:Superoxide dismutase [Cu-Zn] n=1 Tax=Champsocephalus gunnari TaxID=52237 RepID=A0AAN8HS80_CHAGU|nr:hypothetical protein CgunFtcFv8_021981 [Champsocephalus gunnari]
MRLNGSMNILGAAVLVLLAGCEQCVSTDIPPEVRQNNSTLYAACKMRPSTSLPEGLPKVYVPQCPERCTSISLGDLSQGCDSTGGHYNPHSVHHPDHPGDFGNFVAQKGKINTMIESEATLFTGLSVIGRAVVIHEREDDLGSGGDAGSLLSGNAGRRLGCCIIGISPPSLWNMKYEGYNKRKLVDAGM